jgi:hypothetical protein
MHKTAAADANMAPYQSVSLVRMGKIIIAGPLPPRRIPGKYGSIALFVGEEVGGRSRSVEKSKSGTFPPRLEIPQERRDFHFSHRPHDDYN